MAASFPCPSSENGKWYFTREQLENSPSRRAGLDPDKELSYRQQAANLLQDMGQRLNVSQLTINTAIVYMQRFYMVQSFTRFHRNVIAPATLFLAAKVEEQPRKLEHVIKVAHACLNPQDPSPDTKSDAYLQQAQDLVILESIILQTLAFEITIDHPHTHVVKCTQLVRASKDLAQTSYFMATNSLHLTTFSLQYSPPIVACVCIHLACKWSNWEIPVSADEKHWWEYVDPTVTLELLDELTQDFLQILEKTPNRLKRIRNWKVTSMAGQTTKKSKLQEGGGDQTDTLMSMISMASSEMALAGLMSMSAATPPSSTTPPEPSGDQPLRATEGPQQYWQAQSKLVPQVHRTAGGEQPGVTDQGLGGADVDMGFPSLQKWQAAPAKVSLSEYRAKHAEELAAQKRKLECREASRKEQYATATQQKRDRPPPSQRQRESVENPSPIVLKIPIGNSEKPEKGSLKMRIPMGGSGEKAGSAGSGSGRPEEIKVRIRVPAVAAERQSSSDEGSGKSKDKHREHSSNHRHHLHSHKNPRASTGSKRSSDSSSSSSHSTPQSGASSRKRPHFDESVAAMPHNHQPKAGQKSSRSYQPPLPPLPPSSSSSSSSSSTSQQFGFLDLPFMQQQPAGGSGKVPSSDANGHGANSQPNDYQDTFDMLNSLLSAQGVQPAPPPQFDYVPSPYGEYRYPGLPLRANQGNRGGSRPPPLPADPPPPLPPLPK
ncbi:cyclin-T1-like isoform X1 [Acipenser ruthenus]|uniref:cyclin-T1-like isoform X1 n=1 Tax=Acipenser ruthenus TaxID=7906 RepID=UPI00274136DA|nr:cyclin-T1-like isoform X1 [Acipenser ruthenus]